MAEPFYITTAISYPNGRPHIGHAYEAIAADAMARFRRAQGRDVRFVTGTDEHGLKMIQTARADGRNTLEFADEMSGYFRDMCRELNISYDAFVRTSEPRHYEASAAIWQAMEAAGDLYLDRYEGWYSVRDEAFYDESELVEGESGEKLSPQGTPVDWTAEETWFFRLSKYQEPLLALYRDNPDFIRPESRRNEVTRFVEGGLKDLSVSRTSFDWGVPVPGSPGHVMYVWVDALTTYMTGVGFPEQEGEFARYWPADVHLIGKDIVRFHAVYWPAFLMSAGLPLPRQVFGHGFILAKGGEKMSKSLGNVVDPLDMAEQYGVDALRYFLLREVSFGQDGSYSHEAIVNRVNSELANSFGNLAQRSLSMIWTALFLRRAKWRKIGRCWTRLRRPATNSPRNSTASHSPSALKPGWARCSPATPISTPRRLGRSRRAIRAAWRPCWGRLSWRSGSLPKQLSRSFRDRPRS
jgi:methionyl-tRNA synthetase